MFQKLNRQEKKDWLWVISIICLVVISMIIIFIDGQEHDSIKELSTEQSRIENQYFHVVTEKSQSVQKKLVPEIKDGVNYNFWQEQNGANKQNSVPINSKIFTKNLLWQLIERCIAGFLALTIIVIGIVLGNKAIFEKDDRKFVIIMFSIFVFVAVFGSTMMDVVDYFNDVSNDVWYGKPGQFTTPMMWCVLGLKNLGIILMIPMLISFFLKDNQNG